MRKLTLLLCCILLASCMNSRRMRMKAELSKADSMNQAYVPMDTMVQSLTQAVAYFGRHGNRQEKVQAEYLLGCAFRDNGNAPHALEAYQKALSQADTAGSDGDYQIVSRICGQMAELFRMQSTPRIEIRYNNLASRFALLAKDTASALIFQESNAGAYHMMNRLDSALTVALSCSKEFQRRGQQDLAASALVVPIDIYVRQGQYKEARKALDYYDRHSGLVDTNGDVADGHEVMYYYKGMVCYGLNRLDSAMYFFRRLLRRDLDFMHGEAGCKGMMLVYRQLGNADSVARYATLFASYNDSTNLHSASKEIVRMQSLYDYSESDRIAQEKAAENRHLQYALALILTATMLLGLLIYKMREKRRREREDGIRIYHELQQMYDRSCNDLKQMEADHDAFFKEKKQEVASLRQRLQSYEAEHTNVKKWETEHGLMGSPVVVHFRDLVRSGQIASASELLNLDQQISADLPDFHDKLHQESYRLTNREKQVALLVRTGFSTFEISTILGVSAQNLTNIRASINRKLFDSKGAKSLEANLASL